MTRTIWEEHTFDDRSAAMLTEAARLLESRAVGYRFLPSQGSYNTSVSASGNTHAGGGAVDIALRVGSDYPDSTARMFESTLREVGFAAWYRPAIPGLWPRHVHGVAMDCPDASSAAKNQMVMYLKGFDGLASWGRDTGTRYFVGRTWESYSLKGSPGSSIPNLPSSPSTTDPGSPIIIPTPPTEDDMYLITQLDVAGRRGRGIALVGGAKGFHQFNPEEWGTYKQLVLPKVKLDVVVIPNDANSVGSRQWDLVKAVHTQ